MRIHVNARRFSQTVTLRELVEERLRRTFGRFACQVDEAHVSIDDVNGPRGGVDVQCRIRLRILPAGEINVSALADTPGGAIAEAALRARRCLESRLQRWREVRRRTAWNSAYSVWGGQS